MYLGDSAEACICISKNFHYTYKRPICIVNCIGYPVHAVATLQYTIVGIALCTWPIHAGVHSVSSGVQTETQALHSDQMPRAGTQLL